MTHKWINTLEHTVINRPYYNLYRTIVSKFPVDILRNQFDTDSGIYIVGREPHISMVEQLICTSIDKIEAKVKRKKFLSNVGMQKEKYRLEWIDKIINEEPLLTFGSTISDQSEKFFRTSYIEQSNLKSFKPFK